jgi:hypothetical protein
VAKSDFLACFSNEEVLEAGQNTIFLCFFFLFLVELGFNLSTLHLQSRHFTTGADR